MRLRSLFFCAVMLSLAGVVPWLFAQPPLDGPDIGGGGRGGVYINATGILTRYAVMDVGMMTLRQKNDAMESYLLPKDVSVRSPMRCISLNRLEKAIIEANGKISDEMMYLAGIYRITHVFYFPETKDIVIAGPAEGWYPGYEGVMVGRETSLPICELQDLVLALRTYAPKRELLETVGCSIDPTEEGIKRLAQYQAQNGRVPIRQRQGFVDGVRKSVGAHTIRVDGVPAKTNAARIMVAADYRMKLIGLGLEKKPVQRMDTFIDNTVPNANGLIRWYFVPDYESVILTEDRTGLGLVGEGVKLVGAPGQDGNLDPGSKAFTRSFTQHYPQIAKQSLVFAQLRNWIDMLICAAHIQREDFHGKSGWSMEFFGSEEKYKLENYHAPQEVEAVVGQTTVRGVFLTPVGGGVEIDAEKALDDENAKADKDNRIANNQKKVALNLPDGVWWWDVK